MAGHCIWTDQTRKRANRDHAHKKLVRAQKQHLKVIKTERQLREIRQGSRRRQS